MAHHGEDQQGPSFGFTPMLSAPYEHMVSEYWPAQTLFTTVDPIPVYNPQSSPSLSENHYVSQRMAIAVIPVHVGESSVGTLVDVIQVRKTLLVHSLLTTYDSHHTRRAQYARRHVCSHHGPNLVNNSCRLWGLHPLLNLGHFRDLSRQILTSALFVISSAYDPCVHTMKTSNSYKIWLQNLHRMVLWIILVRTNTLTQMIPGAN